MVRLHYTSQPMTSLARCTCCDVYISPVTDATGLGIRTQFQGPPQQIRSHYERALRDMRVF